MAAMGTVRRRNAAGLLVATLLVFVAPAGAIITLGPPGRNLTPPTKEYAGSGWQYQGLWGANLGTAIGPHHFLTAKHVGGSVGNIFQFDGSYFETIDTAPIPGCDLTVWTVAGTLPRYAPLFTGKDEEGREIVMFGRGTDRGDPISINGKPRGWLWGSVDRRTSWGVNWVIGGAPSGGNGALSEGEKLVFDFSEGGGPNEGCISNGDSGGGVFLREKGQWMLAGILYGAGAQYAIRENNRFQEFSGAIYDPVGLWRPMGEKIKSYVPADPDTPLLGSTLSYATRVSAYVPQIQSILDRPLRHRLWTRRRVAAYGIAAMLLLWVLVGMNLGKRGPHSGGSPSPRLA